MNTSIKNLGKVNIPSPLLDKYKKNSQFFISDSQKVIYNVHYDEIKDSKIDDLIKFEKAGPRENIYFDPSKVKVAIVTCGGLCPGLNNVLRSLVMGLYYGYGAKNIIGIPYGYNGFLPGENHEPIELNPDFVDDIHNHGGTILGSSRGGTDDMELLVDSIEKMNINILFTIGGDGTLRGAHEIARIASQRGTKLSVIGIPKTIDNDVSYVSKTFGFETAFSKACEAISCAHTEAKGAPNGIGLVKVMGRHSGYIAASATLAVNDVNFILIPEVPFDLKGPNGFLSHLEARIMRKDHAVICVAEGAGQEMMNKNGDTLEKDASGNVKLADIGLFLKGEIKNHFKEKNIEVNIKYIDPSYMIRSTETTPNDSVFCALLGQYAVHAGMSGKTDMIVGIWNNEFTHLPIDLVVSQRNQITPDSPLWYSVLQATGQAPSMKNNKNISFHEMIRER